MKLVDFMLKRDVTPEGFARRIGVTAISVNRYLAGTRLPAPDVMVKIFEVTNGAVSPNDFLLPAKAGSGPREAAE